VKQNISADLKKSLSPVQLKLIQLVAAEATAMGFPLYMVGGVVRDLLLGRANLDLDLVVEGDAPALGRVLAGKYDGKVTVHSRFGTAKWDIRESRFRKGESAGKINSRLPVPEYLDLVSARNEAYKHTAALPTVKMGNIEDDLGRRDFTINTLAVRLDSSYFGDLRDDYGGVEDLQRGLVRVLHTRSFVDDPTRMYRAIRYEQRFGFRIVEETLALIPDAMTSIERLSPQRIRHELDLILDEPTKASILARLAELKLLKPIHAALPWDSSVQARFQVEPRPELINRRDDRLTAWLLWLLELSKGQIESLNKRLHFTAPLLRALLAASWLFADLTRVADRKPSEWVEYLDEVPLMAVYAVYLGIVEGKSKLALKKYLSEWRHVKPSVTGNDLKKRGLPPGPVYQKILRELRNAWLDQEVQDIEAEKKRLEEILREF
jgi:tRNA nucleotidyltransferase (CCA-adding enzyme)